MKPRISILIGLFFCLLLATCRKDNPSSPEPDPSEPPEVTLDREDAITQVREELVDSLAEKQAVLALAMQEPLAVGTKIFQAGAADDSLPVMTAADPAYFIFVDPFPAYMYGHPVIYVLVNANTGAITTEQVNALPVIDGETLYGTLDERMTSTDRFEPESDNDPFGPPSSPNTGSTSSSGSGLSLSENYLVPRITSGTSFLAFANKDGECKKVAVIWAAHGDQYILNNGTNMQAMLEDFGFEVHSFNSVDHTLDEAKAGYDEAAEGLGPCDKFLFYFTGHTADANEDGNEIEEGERASNLTWGLGQGEDVEQDISLIHFAQNYLNKLEAGTVNIVIDACFAGSLIDFLENPGVDRFKPELQPGVEVNVFTSSAKDRAAFGAFTFERIADYLGLAPSEISSKYTEELIEHLKEADVDADGDGEVSVDEFENAFGNAHDKLNEDLGDGEFDFYEDQAPQSKTFTGADPKAFTLTVTTSGDGKGVVNSKPAGIDQCFDQGGENCNEDYPEGSEVELTATSDNGSFFAGWSGDCSDAGEKIKVTVVMDADRSCDAEFRVDQLNDALQTRTGSIPGLNKLEAPFYAVGAFQEMGYSTPRNKFSYTSQQEEVSFGDLTGTYITAFSGAGGFVVIDLLDGEVLLDETDGTLAGPPLFGVIGLSEEPPGPGSAHAFVYFGQNGINMIDTQGSCCVQQANQPPAFDAVPAGGNLFSGYAVTAGTVGVNFIFYDEAQDLYRFKFFSESGIPANRFDGEVISAWMPDDGTPEDTPALVLTRETESGVYLAKRDGSNPVRAIDNIGFDARKMRCIDDGSGTGNIVCVASIFGHDRLGLLTWDGEGLPTLTDFAEVGAGPVGIDMRLLPDGNIAIVSTGFNDNTVTVTIVAPNGIVQSSNTQPVLEGCQSPGHAIFIEDAESLKIVGTCYDSSNYFIMESEL